MANTVFTVAFHGDPTLKAQMQDRLARAGAEDCLIVGATSWDGLQGTMAGLLGEGDAKAFAAATGIPASIGDLFDLLLQFVAQTSEAAVQTARAWIEALPVGADTTALPSQIVLRMLTYPEFGAVEGVRHDVVRLHEREARGLRTERNDWSVVRATAVAEADATNDSALAMTEAAAWSPLTSRTVLTDTFRGWLNARVTRAPDGDWDEAREARSQETLEAIAAEHQEMIDRGERPDYSELFLARDPELARGFLGAIDRYQKLTAGFAQDAVAIVSEVLAAASDDPFLWMEEIEGEAALAQVREWNAITDTAMRAHPDFAAWEVRAREIMDDDRRIVYPSLRKGMVYNYWTDAEHLRGVWRRCSEASYLAGAPEWDVLIDVDALCDAENANWVWAGSMLCDSDDTRAIVSLSDGGGDAVEVREYDLTTRRFVTDGFTVPAGRTQVCWIDRDAVLVATYVGEGSLTDSSYPREVRHWRRGTVLADAPCINAVAPSEMLVSPFSMRDSAGRWLVILRQPSFWTSEVIHVAADLSLHRAPLPADARLVTSVAGMAIAKLQTDGPQGPAGALVGYSIADLIAGRPVALETVLLPPAAGSIEDASGAHSLLYVSLIENVVGRVLSLERAGPGDWRERAVKTPANNSLFIAATEPESDRLFYVAVGITQPETLHLQTPDGTDRIVATAPTRFDPDRFVVEQRQATSKDGTVIPYFFVRPRDATGPVPTLLYGYGGFRDSQVPGYVSPMPQFLIEEGFGYAIANIRGGGEFGPAWHAAALRENRQRSFDDFHAVAEHLKASGVTSRLGIQGGSNGGLLVGVAYTQRPDLYDAVIMAVPLADMKRYHTLLAGASWMDEYGNPDVAEDWAFLRLYSPYHNLRAGVAYPPVLFQTSTKDDRVHPGHARKMAARMSALGYGFDYYENIDGGHGGSADNSQAAYQVALLGTWLRTKLER